MEGFLHNKFGRLIFGGAYRCRGLVLECYGILNLKYWHMRTLSKGLFTWKWGTPDR